MKVQGTILVLCGALALTFGLAGCSEASTGPSSKYETNHPELIPQVVQEDKVEGCKFSLIVAAGTASMRSPLPTLNQNSVITLAHNFTSKIWAHMETGVASYPAIEGKDKKEIGKNVVKIVQDTIFYLVETGNNVGSEVSKEEVGSLYMAACLADITLHDVVEQDIGFDYLLNNLEKKLYRE